MINVGILGGEEPLAGELIRILINHPDVTLKGVCAPALDGHDVTSVHHGLIGETTLKFVSQLDYNKLDVLCVTLPADAPRDMVPNVHDAPELCVIDLTADFDVVNMSDALVVYGVPEINRKALVRGAKRAVIPSGAEVVTAIALYPMAQKAMLPPEVEINLSTDDIPAKPVKAQHLESLLQPVNMEKPLKINFHSAEHPLHRAIAVQTEIETPMPLDNVIELYEEMYDDHNLTHIVNEDIDLKEVIGTDKCIVSLTKKNDGKIHIVAMADAALRGGAGDAVHVMNLLMGLYEKTGLSLKANMF